MAVASRVLLSLYALAPADASTGESEPTMRASLRWRVSLCAHTRGLDVASLAPGAVPAATHGVCAIASAMGLKVLSSAHDGTQVRRPLAQPFMILCCPPCPLVPLRPATSTQSRGALPLLHAGIMFCCTRFSDDASLLAAAAMDGRVFVHQRANSSWSSSPTLQWCVCSPCERITSLDFSTDSRRLALCGEREIVVCAGARVDARG